MAKGGKRSGAGRKAGVPNKITTELKEMIRGALDKAHPEGAEAYLVQQAQNNPNAFLTLLGKTIPSDINAKLSGAVKVNGRVEFV